MLRQMLNLKTPAEQLPSSSTIRLDTYTSLVVPVQSCGVHHMAPSFSAAVHAYPAEQEVHPSMTFEQAP